MSAAEMVLRLVSHVSGDGDLLEAWFRYYIGLGITSFHLIVHGSREENAKVFALRGQFPVIISDNYEGEFTSVEKKRRIDSVLATMTGQWLLVVDSDEFVEFPFRQIPRTIRLLELARANAIYAPMLQHMKLDGSLNTPEVIDNPFRVLPLCSVSLYEKMGTKASISKCPLFYCTNGTALSDGGNHSPPLGAPPATCSILGVTHHFKFRNSILQRLDRRIHSSHPWRHESAQFHNYLESHDYRLPLDGSFIYSRAELFRRGLLRRVTLRSGLRWVRRSILKSLE
jgi:hypothetical protein